MAVKRVKLKRNRAGTRFDEKLRCYIGFQIDTRINGKRLRSRIFPTRKEAENHIEILKLDEMNGKLNLTDTSVVEIFLAVREKRIGLDEFKEVLTEFLKKRIKGK